MGEVSGDLVDKTSMPDDSNWPKITSDDYCSNCRCFVITRAPLGFDICCFQLTNPPPCQTPNGTAAVNDLPAPTRNGFRHPSDM